MNEINDSLIEIAYREMTKKRKPKTLDKICKDVFEIKGIKYNDKDASQFQIDFMLSGNFICCGEDKNGEKLWDLKSRQLSNLLDKDGSYLDDPYDDDDDVKENELKDDMDYLGINDEKDDNYDEEEDNEETDEIEEELMSNSDYEEATFEIEDDDDEDSYDDEE